MANYSQAERVWRGGVHDFVSVPGMAYPPSDARSSRGYLVAAPARKDRAPWITAMIAGAFVIVLAAGVLTVGVTGSGAATAEPSLAPGDGSSPEQGASAAASQSLSTVVNGRTLLLQTPATATPIGRVILFADRGTDAASALTSGDAEAFTRSGWAVAAVEGAGSDWGSPAGQTATADLLAWSATHVAAAPLVVVTYGSGTASAIAGIAAAGAAPTCWASTDPVSDVVAAAAADPSLEGEITAAWGRIPAPEELPRATVAALSTATSYRVLAPGPGSSEIVREDAASLVATLEETGHDATTVDLGADRGALVTAMRGCGG